MSQLDIYGKAVCYDGMYQIAKKKGEWKVATENVNWCQVFSFVSILFGQNEMKRMTEICCWGINRIISLC